MNNLAQERADLGDGGRRIIWIEQRDADEQEGTAAKLLLEAYPQNLDQWRVYHQHILARLGHQEDDPNP